MIPVVSLGGGASLTVAIPPSAALVGGTFYNQAFTVDLGGNKLGVVVSNAACGTSGSR